MAAWLKQKIIQFHRIAAANGGPDAVRLASAASRAAQFVRDVARYREQSSAAGAFPINVRDLWPILTDAGEDAGSTKGHYFHQDLWAARKVFARRPATHVDIGSRIDGFVAHLLTFMPVSVIDVRPLASNVDGLRFVQDDATTLGSFATNSLDSMSSLHAIEHFGLGRYGDPISPNACFEAMANLRRVLAPGGRLYFSVPIGRERVEFNAQRVFAPDTILHAFDGLSLLSFAAVNDSGDLVATADPKSFVDAKFACGLFEFTK